MDCAVRLGKTQIEFERGYYVMDLFDVLESSRKFNAEKTLETLTTLTMSRTADVDAFTKYANELQRIAGAGAVDKPKFDESGFAHMKMRLQSGI